MSECVIVCQLVSVHERYKGNAALNCGRFKVCACRVTATPRTLDETKVTYGCFLVVNNVNACAWIRRSVFHDVGMNPRHLKGYSGGGSLDEKTRLAKAIAH